LVRPRPRDIVLYLTWQVRAMLRTGGWPGSRPPRPPSDGAAA